MIDPEEIEDLSHRVVDEVVDRFRMKIEGGHGRKEDGSHAARLDHQLQMSQVERCLPDHQNKFSPLLECDIGCPDQQVLIVGVGDAREGSY